jgi:CRISPR-associated protein Csd2
MIKRFSPDLSAVLNNHVTMVTVVSSKNSNQNGDPDNGNHPRMTHDNRAIMSSMSIKSKMRYVVDAMVESGLLPASRNEIFVRSEVKFNTLIEGVHDALHPASAGTAPAGAKGKKGKAAAAGSPARTATPLQRAQTTKQLCSTYFDFRALGQVAGTGDGIANNGRGAIQIGHSESVDAVQIYAHAITNKATANESQGSKNMGTTQGVQYALFRIPSYVAPYVARNVGLTYGDLDTYATALSTMFDVTRSYCRAGMHHVVTYVFVHIPDFDEAGEPVGKTSFSTRIPHHELERCVITRKKDGVTAPTDLEDYDIAFDQERFDRLCAERGVPAGKIEVIEYRGGDLFKASVPELAAAE